MNYDVHALERSAYLLASKGIQVVKLYGVRDDYGCTCGRGDCRTPGKHPAGGDGWQHRATVEEDEIATWFEDLRPTNRINIGIRLGSISGIIDIEVDGPEALTVLQRYGLDKIDTPTYKAARGEHRLFRFDQRLPDVGVVHVDELEVRIGGGGKASQSVAPCSWHGSGIQYQWLPGKSIDEVEPAELPEAFLLAIVSNSRNKGSGAVAKAAAAIIERKKATAGGRHAFLVGVASRYAARIRRFTEADRAELHELVSAFNQVYCDPPKEPCEFERLVNDQFEYYRTRRDVRQVEHPLERYGLEWDGEAREYASGSWRLTLVHSNPSQYRLVIPNPEGRKPFIVTMLTEDWETPRKVAQAIQEQTKSITVSDPSPARWAAIWTGERVREGDGWRDVRGLKLKLWEERENEQPNLEDQRHVTNGNILLGYLNTLSQIGGDTPEANRPLHSGLPKWIETNGKWTLWFKWHDTLSGACKSRGVSLMGDGDKRALATAICEAQGVEKWHTEKKTFDGKSGRWILWSEADVDALARMCGA